MSRDDDGRIVWRITLVAPFLNPIAIMGVGYAAFLLVSGVWTDAFGLALAAVPVAIVITLAIGFVPAILTAYRLVRLFRDDVAANDPPTQLVALGRGAVLGLLTSAATSGLVIAFLIRDIPVWGVAMVVGAFAVGAGAVSGAVAGWMARRRLSATTGVDMTAFD